MNTTLKDTVARLLPQVENPARYIGGEGNQVRKDPATCTVSWALVFPDTYELGMSNNALKVLYHLVNRVPQWRAERAFAPWPDMGKLLLDNKVPLYTLESYEALSGFDLVGITLQTELNYTNIPYVLELSHIPMWAGERGENDPIVVGGGPCTANPEPVAPFFDIVVIGDGEVLTGALSELMETRKANGHSRRWFLEEAAKLRGVYVPELIDMERNAFGEWVPVGINGKGSYKNAKGVQRTWVDVLNPQDMPQTQVIPNCEIVHDRFAVEVMRGCTQGCRFCQAGYWYRPNRELAPDAIIDLSREGLKATGSDELGLLSLSTADYSQIAPLTDRLVDDPSFRNVNLSLPSLRANSFGQALSRKIARARGTRSATFAPETGSQRLRKVINKTITDEDMIQAAEGVFKNGWNSIKLYTMIGLPTETMEDMEAFCGLIQGLFEVGRRYNRRAEIHASIGILVPKPFTPMQWVPFEEREAINERIRFVREAFRYNKAIRISWTGWETAWLEAVLARGDRSLAPVILEAYRRGTYFDSHDKNSHDLVLWRELFEAHGIQADSSTYRIREADEVFPWDFIHAGVTKGYLRAEHDKMFEAESHEEVPDCKWGACQNCGIPGSYKDIQLAPTEEGQVTLPPPGTYAGKTAKAGPAAGLSQEDEGRSQLDPLAAARVKPREPKPKVEEGAEPAGKTGLVLPRKVQSWRLLFSKRGMSRFLAHHATMELFERALRREGVQFALSQGFNPRPRIKNLGALPVGLAVENEELIVELESTPERLDGFTDRVNSLLPEGLRVESFVQIPVGDLTRAVQLRYTLRLSDLPEEARTALPGRLALLEAKELPPIEDHRGRTFDANAEMQTAKVEGDVLVMTARCNDAGNTVSAFLLFAGLLGVHQDAIRACEVVKAR